MAIPAPAEIDEEEASRSKTARVGLTWRSLAIGLVITVLIDLWVHYAELVLGGERGHTALVNTSIPVGSFDALFGLVLLNLLAARLSPSFRLSQAELLTIYVMSAVSTVLSSSGGLHFLIPTITAAHYFATPENAWAKLLHPFIPHWIAQTDPVALKAFYEGGASLDLSRWATQIAVWSGFLFIFACATLCLTLILRRQWVEREHLPFPTVQLPIALAREGAPILKDRLFWAGTAITFALVLLNTLHYNYPSIPGLNLRATDLTPYLVNPPWSAMGKTRVTFYPFAIGIGYLLSTEVIFSVWFFYWFSKMQAVWGAISGWTEQASTGVQSVYPYLSFQGAGSFLGLALASIWVSRRHFCEVFRKAFSGLRASGSDKHEYQVAVFGLIGCIIVLIWFTVMAGARLPVAIIFVILVLIYLLAATRIRAETGNAWPTGPEIDAFRLLITVEGSRAFTTADLTGLSYVRAATAGQDFRGVCMPHQLDGLKMAESVGMKPGRMALAMTVAVAFGVVVSFIIALFIWTRYGALAKTDAWRSLNGRTSFDRLVVWLSAPTLPDRGGMIGIVMGIGFTMFLYYMRMLYTWWPFHPVGYCISNTFVSYNSWMPFFLAWIAKVVIIRVGGMKMYRRGLPFFFGLIAGDFLGGGVTTLMACFVDMNVYPINW